MKSPSLLSEVAFGAYLVYSPHGSSELSQRSKSLCYQIKQDQAGIIALVAQRLQADFAASPLTGVLGHDVILVPTPRSSPLVDGALWPAARVAEELYRVGLGRRPRPIVTRSLAVPKSAYATPGNRPTAQRHLDSLTIETRIALAGRVTVIDDVITAGATSLAVASLLAATFPAIEVNVFAVVRTMSYGDIDAIRAPACGTITLDTWGSTRRAP